MTNTSATNVSSAFIPIAASDLVWSGSTTGNIAAGWNNITLTTPFNYSGGNILVTFRDVTGSWSSGNAGMVTSGTSGISRYIYEDGGAYSVTNPPSGGTASSDRLNMYFKGGTCLTPSTCAAPIVVANAAGTDAIELNWAPGASETSWMVYQRQVGDSAYTLLSTVSTTNYTATGLNPGIDYEFQVVAVCGNNDMAGYATASTECAPVAVPYTEDFERDYGEYSRNCWTIGSTNLGTNYPIPYVISLTGDPNKLCLIYNGGYMIMPEMNAPLNTLQARFTLVQGGDNVRLIIGLMSDPTASIQNIMPLDTLIRSELDTSSATVNITFPFDMLADSVTGHITFWDAFNDNYNFIDNLVIEPIPACVAVTGVTASNVTTTDATITWEAAGAAATGYIVEYGPRNFAPGTGTTVNATTNSITLTGLNHSSDYDVYVYTVCSGLNDTSINSNRARFTTPCDIPTLPYTENFDNCADPGTTRSPLPNCWNYTMLSTGTYAGDSYTPAVYYTSSTGYTSSGQYCLYLYGTALTVLPEMPTTVDSLYISFHHYTSSPSSYKLIIGAVDSVTPGFDSSFVAIDTLTLRSNENNVLRFLSTYTGTGRYIAFKNYYNNNTYDYSYHYIDDLEVGYMPSCVWPVDVHATGLTTTTAEFDWSICQASDYEYEYGPAGFARGTGTTGTWNSAPYSISGLTLGTQYDIYVRGICSAGDTSEWSDVYTFGTLNADPATVPYFCDFTDTTLTNAGWEVVNGTQNNQWTVGSAESNGTPKALYVSNDNGATNAYTNTGISITYAYRDVILPAGQYALTYDWKANGESTWDYLRAWLVPASQMPTAGFLPDGSTSTSTFNSSGVAPAGWISIDGGVKLNQMTSWQTYEEELNIPAGTYHLLFMWANDGGGGTNPPAAIDNVSLSLNVCPISNITLANVTGSSMQITWTGSSDSYEIEYGPVGFTLGTGTNLTTTTNMVDITGLTGLTNYDIYLRGFCNGSDTSRWYRVNFGTAMCDNGTVLYSYDTTWSETTSSYGPIGYSFYNYGYVLTLLDSAQFAGLQNDITAFAFKPTVTTAGDEYNGMTMWMANVPETSLSASSPIVPDNNHVFTKVIDNTSFNYTDTDWQLHPFDSVFTWDGHSNVLVAVKRDNGSYSSGATFAAHSTTTARTVYFYQDSGPISHTSPSASSSSSGNYVGDMMFYSCAPGCPAPVIVSTTNDHVSATITVSGAGISYELSYGTDLAALGNTMTSTTGVFDITGLLPNTQYFFQVIQSCDSGMVSSPVNGTFTTNELPCFTPDSLQVVATTFSTAELTWQSSGSATTWVLAINGPGNLNRLDTVSTNPYTITGLYADAQYTVAARAICMLGTVESDWSDTLTFTTDACTPVTGVTVSGITASTAMVNWNAIPGATTYRVSYGEPGFYESEARRAEVTTNSYTITGLEAETDYEVYVENKCGEGIYSVVTAADRIGFTTTNDAPTTYTLTVVSNNTAWGTVTGGGTYPAGAQVTLTATANSGYHFDRWNDGDTDATRVVTVTGDATYTANFAEDGGQNVYYTVTVSSNNPAWGSVSGGGEYLEGSTVTITATANDGYRFVEWNDGNTDNPRTFTVTEDVEYIATFEADAQGIDDVESGMLTLFPNPASTSVTLTVSGFDGEAMVEVVDMNGRTVSKLTTVNSELNIDVSTLAQGAYFVRVTGERQTAVRKLIVR